MKKTSLLLLLLGASVLPLNAAVTETYSFSGLNLAIPDGNASGMTLTFNSSSAITSIDSVRVSLDISSDGNGSLYSYLSHDSSIAVLLNRPGRTASNLAGYDDHGFNVTFDDSLVNRDIHVYNSIQAPAAGMPLTGNWQTDARHVDPDLVLDTSSRNADLTSFSSLNANGNWTLFLAGLESGGTTTLNGWSVEITGVPEPLTCTLGTGVLLLGFAVYRRLRR
jgi:subtilisin-like proprotein convertase family protein